jgi:hypothetical protein
MPLLRQVLPMADAMCDCVALQSTGLIRVIVASAVNIWPINRTQGDFSLGNKIAKSRLVFAFCRPSTV